MKTKTYSPNFFSTEFNLDRATVVRILRDVQPDSRAERHPTFSIVTFLAAQESHRAANASPNNDGSSSDSTSLTAARVRIANANAAAKERENNVAAGLLCEVGGVASCVGQLVHVLRESLLSMPGKIADKLTPHSEKDRGEIMEIVKLETYDYMRTVVRTGQEITDNALAAQKVLS